MSLKTVSTFFLIGFIASIALNSFALPLDHRGQRLCNKDAVYDRGYRDGRENAEMSSDFVDLCTVPLRKKQLLEDTYERGYVNGKRAWRRQHGRRHRPKRQCITGDFGQQVCGYGCLKTFRNVKCGAKPGMRCVKNDFGQIACGFQCISTPRAVKCSQYRRHNCVKDSFGNARCGLNCRIDFGKIRCDRE